MRHYHLCTFVFLVSVCVCAPLLSAQTTTGSAGSSASGAAQVACVVDLERVPLTPFGFAMATLKSLGSVRDAASDALRAMDESRKADNPLTLVTGTMPSFKDSANDLICAKRAVQPFTSQAALSSLPPDQRRRIRTAAAALVLAYNKQIAINDRMLQVIKKFSDNLPGNGNLADLTDQISQLQVESAEVWDDLVPPVGMSALLLIQLRSTDENGNFIKTSAPNPGYVERLSITKAQKQAILDRMNEQFPELKDGTPEEKISDSAKTAKLYLNFFEDRMCSDEPATSAANSAVGNQE